MSADWSSSFYAADTNMAYMRQVTGQGWGARSELLHVAKGLESWNSMRDRRGTGHTDREPHPTEFYYWAHATFSATAHAILTDAVNGVSLNDYSPEGSLRIECAHQIAVRTVTAWKTLLTDMIALRDRGQLKDLDDWRAVVQQAVDVLEGARNATLAAYQ